MLQVTNNEDSRHLSNFDANVKACSQVLDGCCKCLKRKTNVIRNLGYSFGIPCHDSHISLTSSHCPPCIENIPDNQFLFCWIEAAKKLTSQNIKQKYVNFESSMMFHFNFRDYNSCSVYTWRRFYYDKKTLWVEFWFFSCSSDVEVRHSFGNNALMEMAIFRCW